MILCLQEIGFTPRLLRRQCLGDRMKTRIFRGLERSILVTEVTMLTTEVTILTPEVIILTPEGTSLSVNYRTEAQSRIQ